MADFDATGDHHAVDGGEDAGTVEVDFSPFDIGLAGFDDGFGLAVGGFGLVELGLGDQISGEEVLGAGEVDLSELETGSGVGELGLGLDERSFVGGGIDLGDELTGFDLGIEVDSDVQEGAGDLATDFDGADGIEGAVGCDLLGDVAFGDGHGAVLDGGAGGFAAGEPAPTVEPAGDEDGDEDECGPGKPGSFGGCGGTRFAHDG